MDLSELSFIEEYRQRARLPDMLAMSGRDGRHHPQATAFIADCILDVLAPKTGTLVDVGCGDGTLIRKAHERASLRLIGTAPTREEVARLAATYDFADFRQCEAHRLALPDRCADYVVANSVLHVALPLHGALREIARIARPKATIFVGEIPFKPPTWTYSRRSIPRLLASSLKHEGAIPTLRFAGSLAAAALSGRWRLFTKRDELCIVPAEFQAVAEACGLSVIKQLPHRSLNAQGEIKESDARLCYVLTPFQN